MSEILSQDEIDALMTAIFNGEIDLNKYTDISPAKALDEIESFENYLIERQPIREKPYGIFDEDIYICEFFDSNGNENILEDIKRKNEEQGYGNIKIPNTDITLINYSFCPRCRTIYSFKEVLNYYINPKLDMRFKSSELQYREDIYDIK